ncbi:hypothetical protein BLA29_015000 [Euroglyphus maynei]|uniref:Uncharacterized protein n=1 Tax=Euroglyphus maynei TaxID=6958 RepID=A0A1Y3AMW6_EURMA|nr:hypothetical protein BLA29_015000 [Euroglyphus maynei]
MTNNYFTYIIVIVINVLMNGSVKIVWI